MANTNTENPQVVKESAGSSNVNNFQSTFEKNQKVIIGAIVAVVVVVGGFFGYRELIQKPNEEKASNALFSAERWFEVDSLNYTLNGDGQHKGVLDVIKKYDGTKAANLAQYYAGMSFLRTGNAQEAIKHLEKFDGKGTPLEFLAEGAMGDAYMDAGQADKGIEMYKKAAANEKDNFTSPLYLFRAAVATEQKGNVEDAKKLYQEVKDKYPQTMQGSQAEKYLARLGVVDAN
ncbi:MAG TPA: tetratricopeptide repeat protein [Arachidicoccus sp.]